MTDTQEYSRGYRAGRKKNEKDVTRLQDELRTLKVKADERQERIYMQSLELALKYCSNWQIGGKPIKNAQGYCQMAKVFADNAITCMDG
jgi:hypothetical protein